MPSRAGGGRWDEGVVGLGEGWTDCFFSFLFLFRSFFFWRERGRRSGSPLLLQGVVKLHGGVSDGDGIGENFESSH